VQPRSDLVTVLEITGFVRIDNATPFRQEIASPETPSPYSPPVRPLKSENANGLAYDNLPLVLEKIQLHAPSIATFTFRSPVDLSIKPGQNIVVDCSSFIGERQYQHMSMSGMEASVNDDGIRTWTVSHFRSSSPRRIGLTLRHKPLGAVTGRLFDVAQTLSKLRPDLLENATPLQLTFNLIGVGGEFTLSSAKNKFLMLAGGIGITPFLTMLSGLLHEQSRNDADVVLGVSTREPDITLKLLLDAVGDEIPSNLKIRAHLFTGALGDAGGIESKRLNQPFETLHRGRIGPEFLKGIGDLHEREVMICGPEEWEAFVTEELKQQGVPLEAVRREGFTY
jgi:ferredoxin-NADP reductase